MKFRRICDQLVPADDEAAELYESLKDGDVVEVKLVVERTRTETQNNALHLWLRQLAKALNDAGLDQRKVLKAEVDIPWSMEAAKESLWRPVQMAMTKRQSTADAQTVDYSAVYSVIVRHLSQSQGFVAPPWPERR